MLVREISSNAAFTGDIIGSSNPPIRMFMVLGESLQYLISH